MVGATVTLALSLLLVGSRAECGGSLVVPQACLHHSSGVVRACQGVCTACQGLCDVFHESVTAPRGAST